MRTLKRALYETRRSAMRGGGSPRDDGDLKTASAVCSSRRRRRRADRPAEDPRPWLVLVHGSGGVHDWIDNRPRGFDYVLSCEERQVASHRVREEPLVVADTEVSDICATKPCGATVRLKPTLREAGHYVGNGGLKPHAPYRMPAT
jgi:hypothetical protein